MIHVWFYFRSDSEDNSSKVIAFQALLDDFMQNSEAETLEFSNTLTSHDRLLIHKV